jgi:hypothetical protein
VTKAPTAYIKREKIILIDDRQLLFFVAHGRRSAGMAWQEKEVASVA